MGSLRAVEATRKRWLRFGISDALTDLRLDRVARENTLGAVVPDIHPHDQAIANDEAIDIAIALERRAVGPFTIERAGIIDHGLADAGRHVGPFHLLLHPLVALGVEAGGFPRVAELAAAGEGDGNVGAHEAGSLLGIRDHRRDETPFDQFRGLRGLVARYGNNGLRDGHEDLLDWDRQVDKSDERLSRSLAWFEGSKHSPIGLRPRERIGSDFRGFETQRAERFRQLDRARDPVDDGK